MVTAILLGDKGLTGTFRMEQLIAATSRLTMVPSRLIIWTLAAGPVSNIQRSMATPSVISSLPYQVCRTAQLVHSARTLALPAIRRRSGPQLKGRLNNLSAVYFATAMESSSSPTQACRQSFAPKAPALQK